MLSVDDGLKSHPTVVGQAVRRRKMSDRPIRGLITSPGKATARSTFLPFSNVITAKLYFTE